MFFSKKKIKALMEQNTAEVARTVETLNRDMTSIEAITDMGERYLALVEIEKKIQSFTDQMQLKASQQAGISRGTGIGLAFGSIGIGMGGYVAAMLVNPLLYPVILVLPLVTSGAKSVEKHKKKILSSGLANDLERLNSIAQKVAVHKKDFVENHVLDLGKSKYLDEVCSKCPDVASAFARRAAKDGVLDIPRVVKLDKKGPKPSS
ncbi:MAG: hypothetical protein HY052_03120 [Proteobacteria bacterium]|nr:hypothetical protein [Pseudomonadota bacterium]